jgi:FkbM family methyltransferase
VARSLEDIMALCDAYEHGLPVIPVQVRGKAIKMAAPNQKCLGFALEANTREPATNGWIFGFRPGDIFFDVGSNNGLYGLLAAVVSDCIVHAFEPHFASYHVIARNIYLNKLEDRMTVYPLAVSDRESYGHIFLSSTRAGKSLNNFGAARPSDDILHNATIPQGAVSTSLDRFVALTGIVPNHVKIDVDGLEPEIIDGATELLKHPALRSMMVEADEKNERHRAIHDTMLAAGFTRFVKDVAGNFYFRT